MAFATPTSSGVLAFQPKSRFVFIGSSRMLATSSAERGRTSTGLFSLMAKALILASDNSLMAKIVPVGDVVIPLGALAGDGLHDAIDQVIDVDEIAPCIHDKAGLPGRQPLVEGRQGTAEVARAVGVGQAEGDVVQSAEVHVLLATRLA